VTYKVDYGIINFLLIRLCLNFASSQSEYQYVGNKRYLRTICGKNAKSNGPKVRCNILLEIKIIRYTCY
jgi:hypothetical protein